MPLERCCVTPSDVVSAHAARQATGALAVRDGSFLVHPTTAVCRVPLDVLAPVGVGSVGRARVVRQSVQPEIGVECARNACEATHKRAWSEMGGCQCTSEVQLCGVGCACVWPSTPRQSARRVPSSAARCFVAQAHARRHLNRTTRTSSESITPGENCFTRTWFRRTLRVGSGVHSVGLTQTSLVTFAQPPREEPQRTVLVRRVRSTARCSRS
jgi:hypothetical protein